jgi:phospholipid-translocating P-type ATPase (flippase)
MATPGRHVLLHQTRNDKGEPLFMNNYISTTKYTLLTFLPKNLFEQFSRIANLYFLVIALLLQFDWAPISAAVAVLPLVLVIAISAVREAVEDFFRWRSDQRINSMIAHRLSVFPIGQNSEFVDERWDSILVGDFLLIKKDEEIPADVVVVGTSDPDGAAFVDTCNLDGETNLKPRDSLRIAGNVQTADAATRLTGELVCDHPNNLLYTFNGYLERTGDTVQYPIDNNQVFLRGCILRNVEFVIGVVVYTGYDSKLMKNSSAARTKRSRLEKGLNVKLMSVLAFMVAFSFIGAGVGYVFEDREIDTAHHWYFGRNSSNKRTLVGVFFILFISHLLVINAMIPISLYVTLEVVRIFQAFFVAYDREMYDEASETGASARTSNISDDLGQISYIFSDKTGTLTRNVMEFMKCSIAGVVYGTGTTEIAYAAAKRQGKDIEPPDPHGKAFKDDRFTTMLQNPADLPEPVMHFLWLLAICHAVIPEENPAAPYGIRFQASSPDEAALVLAAADFGYLFKARTSSAVLLVINGVETQIPILANIEFTSTRKRSSVIFRHPVTGKIVIYCKGADDLVLDRLSEESPYVPETRENLATFAANGLRTLCCAYRELDDDFFQQWAADFQAANCSITDREKAVDDVANVVESKLMLIGATAIEDKLQIGVPDTIESLLQAHINVWVITGDKLETAVNIGFACALLTNEMQLIQIDSTDCEEILTTAKRALLYRSEKPLALVATGASLHVLLEPDNESTFYELTKLCQSVVCCRVSPLQKATIVRLMRDTTGALTLAIGDGANDVGMIMQADVGVGISGKEGRQAVLAADYALAQFRFLKRLLLLHGRLNFYRNCDLVNYSFYKNMFFSFVQIIFGFLSSNSGNTMYDSMLYSVFNVIFTSIPPVVYAGLERDVEIDAMLRQPDLYNWDGQRPWLVGYLRFWAFLGLGIFHGLCAFFIPYFGTYPCVYRDGRVFSLPESGSIVYFSVVLLVNCTIAVMSSYWTWLHFVFYILSVLIFLPAVLVVDALELSSDFRGIAIPLLKSGHLYLSAIAVSVLGLLPLVALRAIDNGQLYSRNRIALNERSRKVGGLGENSVKSEEPLPPNSAL